MNAGCGSSRGLWGRERGGRGCYFKFTMLVCGLAVCASASATDPPCYYEVTVLDTVPCGIFGESGQTPYAIADNGWVTGEYPQCNGSGFTWVLMHNEGTEVEGLIPPFEGVQRAEGLDITSNGLIVGWMDIDGVGTRAFSHDLATGEWLELPGLPSTTFSEALGVNNAGVAVGRTGNQVTGPSPLAVMWIEDVPVDLAALLGSPKSDARDIAGNGAVTGWFGDSITTNARAYIWHDANTTILPDLPDARISVGNAISESGSVAGYTGIEDAAFLFGRPRATLWQAGQALDLGVLPGFQRSWANDLNSSDVVVGHCQGTTQSSNERSAFIWRDGVMTALDEVIDPSMNLEILVAYSVNEQGQITAIATGSELEAVSAVILTPPNPADVNDDCVTNIQDLLILLADWGAGPSPADLNSDGVVNVTDLLFLLAHWG